VYTDWESPRSLAMTLEYNPCGKDPSTTLTRKRINRQGITQKQEKRIIYKYEDNEYQKVLDEIRLRDTVNWVIMDTISIYSSRMDSIGWLLNIDTLFLPTNYTRWGADLSDTLDFTIDEFFINTSMDSINISNYDY
jgi:hypothetical protein